MSGMNMDRFEDRHSAASANAGLEFGDVPKLVVASGMVVRLVGDFSSVWEHFVETDKGYRPYYCEGPESDCPLCQAANQLSFSDSPTDQERGKNIKAKEKFYFNAIGRSPAEREWHKVNNKTKLLVQSEKAMNIGSMLFRAIGDVVNMRKQQGQPYDPNTFDIMLSKSGSGMKTKYGAQFTGGTEPLTDAELAYEMWPLEAISKITPRSDRDAAAQYVLGRAPSSVAGQKEAATDFNPANYEAPNPAARAAAPAPAAPPAAAPAPAVPPGQPAPRKLDIKPKKQGPADTTPREDYDESTHMMVQCSSCNADMLIDMEDERDIQCHSCGMIYTHPNRS